MKPATIEAAAAALSSGALSSRDLVEQAIAAADREDEGLGIYLSRFEDDSRAAADAADADRARGAELGPLHGIPLGIKDNISTVEGPTTGQSMAADPVWTCGDATIVRRLRNAGAIVMGKTTLCEFALGPPDVTKPLPVPRNPWDRARWAGGSSSGSASGLAAGCFLGAVGTDTGGSIRMPAAFCGVTGFKPTFGIVPRTGVIPLSYTQDHVGPLARTARDCATLLEVLVEGRFRWEDRQDLSGLRVGVTRHPAPVFAACAVDEPFEEAVATLAQLGATMVEISLPAYTEMATSNFVIMLSEALAVLRGGLSRDWDVYFRSTRLMVGSAAFLTAVDYVQAQRVREWGKRAIRSLFEDVDLVVMPTSYSPALRLDEVEGFADGFISGQGLGDLQTSYWDAAGNPVAAIPVRPSAEGLPLGIQLVGPLGEDALVLRAADLYQQETNWHLLAPTSSTGAGDD